MWSGRHTPTKNSRGERPHASQRICENAQYFDILLFFYSTSHLLPGVHTSVILKAKPILWRIFDSLQNSRPKDIESWARSISQSINQSINQFPSLSRVRRNAPLPFPPKKPLRKERGLLSCLAARDFNQVTIKIVIEPDSLGIFYFANT